MARKRYSDDDALESLLEIDVYLYNVLVVFYSCRRAEFVHNTYYCWRTKFGGMGRSQLSKMRVLRKGGERLKKIFAELQPDKLSIKKLRFFRVEGLTIDMLRQACIHTCQKLNSSKRQICLVVSLLGSSLRYQVQPRNNEVLRLLMIRLAKRYGEYHYRKVTVLLQMERWRVSYRKIESLWSEKGLQLPHRQNRCNRLYHKDSSIIRLRPHIPTTSGYQLRS